MSDFPQRLLELQRQRAAIAAHLAWLDAQIARTQLAMAPSEAETQPPPDSAHSATAAPENLPPSAESAAARILAEYHASRSDVRDEVRRGCLLYAAFAMALAALALGVLYYFTNLRPGHGRVPAPSGVVEQPRP